ncbi:MAG: nucleotidyltransferase family protein [Alphaproteobacteria bacterium]|nr:nucleotidyltransferase family protein [Alphaproteobacteria bacterium]
MKPETAFILAAGLGTRMRPLTDAAPKPMLRVGGQTMIDRALDELATAGVKRCGVNTHYLAGSLEEHLAAREDGPEIFLSYEEILLETGGGLKKALDEYPNVFGEDFFVLSGDSVWQDVPGQNVFEALGRVWNPQEMDILLLLQPVERMVLTHGVGDYDVLPDGRAERRVDKSGAYMFTSIRINSPRIFDGVASGRAFSYLELMDAAERAGRLYAMVYEGDWHHISTPEDLARVNEAWECSDTAARG